MDIGNFVKHGHLGQPDSTKIICFKGQLGITVQGSNSAVDYKIRLVFLKILFDVFWLPQTQPLAVRAQNFNISGSFRIEIMHQSPAEQAGTADYDPESLCGYVKP